MTAQEAADCADVLNSAGLDSKDKLVAFLESAEKPVARAKVQAKIDKENADFAQKQQAHNDALAALQSQLNAI